VILKKKNVPESNSKQEQQKGANSEKLEILLPKNDKTLEEGIRLPTMEDLYFQKNDKTLKDVPRKHCQTTTLRTRGVSIWFSDTKNREISTKADVNSKTF
jgi:hypothetical protein